MAEMETELQPATSQEVEEEGEQPQQVTEHDEVDVNAKAELLNQGTEESPIDTTEDFLKVFKGMTEFSSWDEFTSMFEEFQRVTGSAFKPKSATSIEYANERRAKDKIPEKFVYQTVKMVCIHYGESVKKGAPFRKPKKYVGLGCEAMVHLRYKQGSLNIVSCNLEHKNHSLHSGNEIIRSVRSFSFSDEVDALIAKVVLEHSPYTAWNPEKQWAIIVEDLQIRDPRLKTVNVRMVKKRTRFLVDRYMSNSNGKSPLPGDDLGAVLYELAQSRHEPSENTPRRGRKRGRPKKYQDDIMDDDDFTGDESYGKRSGGLTKGQAGSKDISAFLQFLQRKDEQDRKFRQNELDLRREELDLHRKEMELQKSKFEFERVERQAHLDLLKAQLDAFTGNKPKEDTVTGVVAKEGEAVTEYTIVVNNEDAFAAENAAAQ